MRGCDLRAFGLLDLNRDRAFILSWPIGDFGSLVTLWLMTSAVAEHPPPI